MRSRIFLTSVAVVAMLSVSGCAWMDERPYENSGFVFDRSGAIVFDDRSDGPNPFTTPAITTPCTFGELDCWSGSTYVVWDGNGSGDGDNGGDGGGGGGGGGDGGGDGGNGRGDGPGNGNGNAGNSGNGGGNNNGSGPGTGNGGQNNGRGNGAGNGGGGSGNSNK